MIKVKDKAFEYVKSFVCDSCCNEEAKEILEILVALDNDGVEELDDNNVIIVTADRYYSIYINLELAESGSYDDMELQEIIELGNRTNNYTIYNVYF